MTEDMILDEINKASDGIFNKWNRYVSRCKNLNIKPNLTMDDFIECCRKRKYNLKDVG